MIIDETTEYRQADILTEDCDGGCAETIGRGHRKGDEARCHDCDRRIFWNEERGDWQHVEEPGRGCFLIGAERSVESMTERPTLTEGVYVLDADEWNSGAEDGGMRRLGRIVEIDEIEGSFLIRYESTVGDQIDERRAPVTDLDAEPAPIVEVLYLPLGPGEIDYDAPGAIGCDHCDAIFGTAEEAEQHESMPHADEEQRAAMLADLVPLARGEILADVLAGRVEPDVPDFRSLHDFVDANEYGSPDLRRVPMSVVAALQEDLDEWIRSGQMAKTVRGLRGEE